MLHTLRAGSPPRTWGKRQTAIRRGFPARFTPTHVGKALPCRRQGSGSSVHPHVRGESVEKGAESILAFGSPPRAWGKRRHYDKPSETLRFTPTCVGKAWPVTRSTRVTGVHPHVRGESPTSVGISLARTGSPPRAWGKPCMGNEGLLLPGFTPTCVGKAYSHHYPENSHTVHPHVRGESHSRPGPPAVPRVHPHVRGESACPLPTHVRLSGSPPRAWGKPHLANSHHCGLALAAMPRIR